MNIFYPKFEKFLQKSEPLDDRLIIAKENAALNEAARFYLDIDSQKLRKKLNEKRSLIQREVHDFLTNRKNIPQCRYSQITLYTLPHDLRQLENLNSMSYLIRYSRILGFRRRMLHKSFVRMKFLDEAFVNLNDMLKYVLDFHHPNSNLDKENVLETLEKFGLDKDVYYFEEFEAVFLFIERYLFNEKINLKQEMNQPNLIEKLDFSLFTHRVNNLRIENKKLHKLLDFIAN
jgi:hypothetical protein